MSATWDPSAPTPVAKSNSAWSVAAQDRYNILLSCSDNISMLAPEDFVHAVENLSCRIDRQSSVVPSTSSTDAVDLFVAEYTAPWANALFSTVQAGLDTSRQHHDPQQQQHAQQDKNRSKNNRMSWPCAHLCSFGCFGAGGPYESLSSTDLQPLTRAERLSLMIAKAHEYTTQYEQVSVLGFNACHLQAMLPRSLCS